MAAAEYSASNFSLVSRWTVVAGKQGNPNYYSQSPTEASTTLSFSYSLPTAAVINNVKFTATRGNPSTGINYVKANDVSMGNTINASGTVTLTNPTALSGTYNVTVKFKANGSTASTGSHSGSCAFTNVKLTINYTINSFNVTTVVSPSGAGTLSASPTSASPGDTVTLTRTTATGYYFSSYSSSPSVTINSSGQFTMPSGAVTITANYLKRSTATVNTKTVTGGGTVVLTITPDKTAYSHKYNLSFGTGMTTGDVTVSAGTTSVTISIPASWSDAIPNAASKTSGTLTVTTYSGTTAIGTYQITDMTYNVPASAVPTIDTLSTDILRTVDGITYADVGEYYVQRHSGVSISASASSVYSATIASMSIAIAGYTGTDYSKTVSAGSISMDSGLLTISGTTTITVTATDSRGRTTTETTTITVTGYSDPTVTLDVWRVDVDGDADPMGTFAKYAISYTYTQVGTNDLQSKELTSQGYTETPAQITGDLLPGDRQSFSVQLEYMISFSVQDAFETTTVLKKLPTGRFVIFVSADGAQLGFMRATSGRPIPTGKSHIVEFSEDSQIYIGNETLEDYIQRIANS